MIPIKTKQEIAIMKEGGKRLAWVFKRVLVQIKPKVKLSTLDQLAESLIKKQNGFPSFKMVEGYKWATCININQGVVHGIPNDYEIKEGDVVSLDMGMFYQGFHTDMARTIKVQGSRFKVQGDKFLEAGERALKKAIAVAKPGNRIGHISAAIEKEIKKSGFSPIKALTGHGVGVKLHEPPQIPCYLKGKIKETPLIKPGMTLAVEVIYGQGRPDLVLDNDGWTVKMVNNRLAGLFEHTVLITKKGAITLTSLNQI